MELISSKQPLLQSPAKTIDAAVAQHSQPIYLAPAFTCRFSVFRYFSFGAIRPAKKVPKVRSTCVWAKTNVGLSRIKVTLYSVRNRTGHSESDQTANDTVCDCQRNWLSVLCFNVVFHVLILSNASEPNIYLLMKYRASSDSPPPPPRGPPSIVHT